MIPTTTKIEQKGSIIWWTNENLTISVAEAESIAREIRKFLAKPNITGIITDNRKSKGTWPAEINNVWGSLMKNIIDKKIKSATLSSSIVNKMHINRLSEKMGTIKSLQAFTQEQQALDFIAD